MSHPCAEKLEGFLITFSGTQLEMVKARLASWGYSPDSDGLRDFILDEVSETDRDRGRSLGSILGEYLVDRPDVIVKGASAVAGFFSRKERGRFRAPR